MKKLFSLFAVIFMAMSMWGFTYTKVTSAPSDWSGEYVVAAQVGENVLIWTGIDAGQCRTTATINAEGKITNDGLVTVTVAALTEGGYSVKVNGGTNDGKYISSGTSAPGYSNGLKFNATAHRVDFAMDENGCVQMSQTIGTTGIMYFIYNKNTGASNERFRFYKDSNLGGSNYATPVLYKKDVAAGIAVTGVTLDKTTAAINVGETTTLVATIAPANADDKTVTWSSSNEAVATVANGVVTGVAAGTATITVTTTDGSFTATCAVTVTAVAVTGVTLDKATATIMEGETETLVATVAPANAANKNIVWTSSDEEVATVENGVVTGVSAGNATITAKTVDGNFTATCAVTVNAYVEPDEIEIIFASASDNNDSGTAVPTTSTSTTISTVFSAGARYVSEITAVSKVYPARNSLGDGVKFGTSDTKGSISITLDKTYNVSKIIVIAAPYGDTEGKQGFILNGVEVSMSTGTNKVYAEYDVDITGEVSEITLEQKTASKGRIYVKGITLVKAAEPATATINLVATDGEMFYATYSNESAFVVSEDIIVSEVSVVEGELYIEEYETGAVVPANTGVLVSALEAGEYTVTLSSEAGTSVLGEDNMLHPAAEFNTTAGTPYRLAYDNYTNKTGLGFYPFGGAVTAPKAGTAFLAVPEGTEAAPRYVLNGTEEVTAVENVEANDVVKFIENGTIYIQKNGQVYNVAGMLVK